MTPQFLRSEAARFRDMAESTDREASRQRLLAMAVDYEAQAEQAENFNHPSKCNPPNLSRLRMARSKLSPALRAARRGSGCRGRQAHAVAFDCYEIPATKWPPEGGLSLNLARDRA